MLQLSEEELKQTISRAIQIVEQQADTPPFQSAQEPFEAYLRVAEEAGIPRQAMLQALREQFFVPMEAIKPGDVVFAPSADKAWYAASVLRVESETSVVVRFLTGGEQSVAATDIRALGLVPGREVEFEYIPYATVPGRWVKGKLLKYDAATQQAEIKNGFNGLTCPVSLTQLRLRAQKTQVPLRVRNLLIRAALVGVSIGGVIGFLLGHLLR